MATPRRKCSLLGWGWALGAGFALTACSILQSDVYLPADLLPGSCGGGARTRGVARFIVEQFRRGVAIASHPAAKPYENS